jgi:RHS repeat-associated protein
MKSPNPAGWSALTRYGFTGREHDREAGLIYYRARWYDPQMGRFISEDPVEFRGGINWYAYVRNSPVRLRDPLGLAALIPDNYDPDDYSMPPSGGGDTSGVWVSAEGGLGFHGMIFGLNGATGLVFNPLTGELCVYVKGCARAGFGMLASAGLKGGLSILAPRCGKDLEGGQVELSGEVTSPMGGASISGGYGSGVGAGTGLGPSWGAGFSVGADVCYLKILYCINSPGDCKRCRR